MRNTWVFGNVKVGSKICLLLALLYIFVVTGKLIWKHESSLAYATWSQCGMYKLTFDLMRIVMVTVPVASKLLPFYSFASIAYQPRSEPEEGDLKV